MSTPTLPQSRPIVGMATAKPQRVGLIAARSKVEAQDLAANVARALDMPGAEVITKRNLRQGRMAQSTRLLYSAVMA